MNQYVDNILTEYHRAPHTVKHSGMHWYTRVHNTCIEWGNLHKWAGVISALSPNMPWDRNIMLATLAHEKGIVEGGTFGFSVNRANAIINGANPLELLNTKTGHKTFNFYLNISNPDNSDAVTIDRHAYDIATGIRLGKEDRGLSSKRRYYEFAQYYIDAAASESILPQQMQAITWESYRSRLPSRRGAVKRKVA